MKKPEELVEFLIGTLIMGSFAIAVSAFILGLGWLTIVELLQWK
jgi:hypothetical protein